MSFATDLSVQLQELAALVRSSKELNDVKRAHATIATRGQMKRRYLRNLLVQMYGKFGSLDEARLVFSEIYEKNLFSWSLIIGACVQNSEFREAVELFWKMNLEGIQADSILFVSVLTACAELELLKEGREVFARVLAGGLETDNILTVVVKLYSRCGSVENARKAFDRMLHRDVIAWNAMISAYAQLGHCKEAVKLLRYMDLQGVKPDVKLFSSLLDAFSSGELELGRMVHARVVASGLNRDLILQTSALNMYGRSGCVGEARKTFDSMERKDVAAWTAMIAAYAHNALPHQALEVFNEMECAKVVPDEFSFSTIMSACSHAGLVEEGRLFYDLMVNRYRIAPDRLHCVCVLDLLGRAGRLEEAEEFLESLPVEADGVLWRTLLASCALHGDFERGVRVARRAILVDPDNDVNYVLLSKLYQKQS